MATPDNHPNAHTHVAPEQRRRYWLYFLVSLGAFFLMLFFLDEWFWIAMPFMLTYLVLALDTI